jgi:hypothetical protein
MCLQEIEHVLPRGERTTTIRKYNDLQEAGGHLVLASPCKPTHLRTVIRTAKKKPLCCMQTYRVPTECTQADGPVKSSVFAVACGSRRPILLKYLFG